MRGRKWPPSWKSCRPFKDLLSVAPPARPAREHRNRRRCEEDDRRKRPGPVAQLHGVEKREDVANDRHEGEEKADKSGGPSAQAGRVLHILADEGDLQHPKRHPCERDQAADARAAADLKAETADLLTRARA